MSQGSSSCFKVIFSCCLITILLLIALAGVAVFTVKTNQMEPPVFEELSEFRQFESHELQGVVLSELPPGVVPIKITIEMEFSNLTVLSDGTSGSIGVSGEYDTKNGIFNFTAKNGADGISGQSFHISYTNENSLLFNIGSSEAEKIMDRNHITIHLPTDSAIDLEIIHSKGSLDLDLGDIPLYMLHVNSKMSEVNIRNMTKNPLVLNDMILEHSMGDFRLHNLQNFRFNQLRLDFTMGDYRLKSNGLFFRSGKIIMDVSLGSFSLRLPENVIINNHVNSSSGTLFLTQEENENQNVEITLEGEVKWCEANVSQ